MSKTKKIAAVIISVVIIIITFFAGFFIRDLTRVSAVSSYEWALKLIEENYVGEYTQEGYASLDLGKYTAEELSLKALVANLDRYSEYLTAAENTQTRNDNAGQKSGIGISYNFLDNKGALLISVTGNSPAYHSGLRAGDLIVGGKVNGESTQFVQSNDIISFISARATGEEFILSTETSDYTVKRENFRASYTCMFTKNTEWGFSTKNSDQLSLFSKASDEMDFLPQDTAYIRLDQFYGSVDSEFDILVNQFNANNLTSMIIDLRNNGGGFINSMQSIGGTFTSSKYKSFVASTAKYKNKEENFYCYKKSGAALVPADTKVYVLANSGTASASEALIGVLVSSGYLPYENIYLSEYSKEYLDWAGYTSEKDRAPRTYGKGIMQTTFENFSTHEALKLTTAKIYWQNGKCIHGVGLREEDGCKTVPAEWIVTKGDKELKSAVEMIKNAN